MMPMGRGSARPLADPAATSLVTNLVAYWKLDEASGTRNDSKGSNHLTDNNTVGQGTGKIGNDAVFVVPGNEYLSRADNTDLSTGDVDFVIRCWVKFTTKTSEMHFFVKGNTAAVGTFEYALYYGVSLNRLRWTVCAAGSLGTVNADNLGSVSTGFWYYVVCWHDSVNNIIGIQVNNGTANTASYSSGAVDTANPFQLGRESGGNYYLNGELDECAFWKGRVLTTAEKTYDYHAGLGRTYNSETGKFE
jgi:hypothetical protein